MDRETYLAEIKAAYEGEIWGEAYFKALASLDRPDEHRRKLLLLAQLEHETAAAMQPLAERLGVSEIDEAQLQALGAEKAEPAEAVAWTPMMAQMAGHLTSYVTRYDALAAAAEPEDKPPLERLAAHERALLVFAEAEMAEETDRSLDAVLALLEG